MKPMNKPLCFFFFSIVITLLLSYTWAADHESLSTRTSIVFAPFGRSSYALDIYTLPLKQPNSTPFNSPHRIPNHRWSLHQLQRSLSLSIIINLYSPLSLTSITTPSSPHPLLLIHVTECNRSSSIFLDALYYDGLDITRKISTL
ncbi:hypothetical protein CsSME_00014843 [Camellia sinensis var. sinensis]